MKEKARNDIFETWISEHKALIFKVVRSYAFTEMDQDDLFQEITLQLWNSIPTFKQRSSSTTWIYRVSLNTAIKWSQKMRTNRSAEPIENAQHILHETRFQTDERLTWLYDEISNLNEVERSITLLLLDGFSYKEIADIVGISESNVGVKINRIKKHLIVKSEKCNDHGI